jgi:hypothetical protein
MSEFFRKTLEQISKISKYKYLLLFVNKQQMVIPNFSSLPASQTDLDKFFTIFQENFKNFRKTLEQISKKSNS